MSEFLKFAYELLSQVVYNIVSWLAASLKLLITGWAEYFMIFKTYFPTLSIVGKILSVLLMLILAAIPIVAIILLVRRAILRHQLKVDNVDNEVLYKEIGRLNKQVLDLMEETLEAGTAVPFAPAKRVVDVDRMRDIIDEVRNNLPDEIRESKKIVNDREQIMKNAQVESETIIQKAEERASALVSEQEIVKRSRQRAAEILTAANTQAKDLTRNATVYCETLLKKSEETLARSVADIKNTRMNLRSATRPNRGGQGGQNQ